MREKSNAIIKHIGEGKKTGAIIGIKKGTEVAHILRALPELKLVIVGERYSRDYKTAIQRVYSYKDRFKVAGVATQHSNLDFVFLQKKEDISHWLPMIKSGGWIGGYAEPDKGLVFENVEIDVENKLWFATVKHEAKKKTTKSKKEVMPGTFEDKYPEKEIEYE